MSADVRALMKYKDSGASTEFGLTMEPAFTALIFSSYTHSFSQMKCTCWMLLDPTLSESSNKKDWMSCSPVKSLNWVFKAFRFDEVTPTTHQRAKVCVVSSSEKWENPHMNGSPYEWAYGCIQYGNFIEQILVC